MLPNCNCSVAEIIVLIYNGLLYLQISYKLLGCSGNEPATIIGNRLVYVQFYMLYVEDM